MLSSPFCRGQIREFGRKSGKSGKILCKLLIIKTIWRSEQDSNWRHPYEAKIRKFPPEFEPTFAFFAVGEFPRLITEIRHSPIGVFSPNLLRSSPRAGEPLWS